MLDRFVNAFSLCVGEIDGCVDFDEEIGELRHWRFHLVASNAHTGALGSEFVLA